MSSSTSSLSIPTNICTPSSMYCISRLSVLCTGHLYCISRSVPVVIINIFHDKTCITSRWQTTGLGLTFTAVLTFTWNVVLLEFTLAECKYYRTTTCTLLKPENIIRLDVTTFSYMALCGFFFNCLCCVLVIVQEAHFFSQTLTEGKLPLDILAQIREKLHCSCPSWTLHMGSLELVSPSRSWSLLFSLMPLSCPGSAPEEFLWWLQTSSCQKRLKWTLNEALQPVPSFLCSKQGILIYLCWVFKYICCGS